MVATTPTIFAAVAVAVATRKLPPQLANALEPYGGSSDLAEISFATLQQLSRFLYADSDLVFLRCLRSSWLLCHPRTRPVTCSARAVTVL